MQLSICIPTYNRASELKYLLDNILGQITEDNLSDNVEICISDNYSTDNTQAVVQLYQNKYPFICYYKQAQNLGFDRNLLHVLKMAKGKFCWIFGDDDRFEHHALIKILLLLLKYPQIAGASVNAHTYNNFFKNKVSSIINLPELSEAKLLLSSSEIIDVLGAYMGFIAGQIVNREQMLIVLSENNIDDYFNKFMVSAFIHLFVFNLMIKQNPQWLYVPDKLVGNRCLDPIVTENNFEHRINGIRIYYDFAYAANLLPDLNPKNYDKMLNDVVKSNIYTQIKQLKLLSSRDITFLFGELKSIFGDCRLFWLKVVPLIFCPRFVLITGKKVYLKLKNKY